MTVVVQHFLVTIQSARYKKNMHKEAEWVTSRVLKSQQIYILQQIPPPLWNADLRNSYSQKKKKIYYQLIWLTASELTLPTQIAVECSAQKRSVFNLTKHFFCHENYQIKRIFVEFAIFDGGENYHLIEKNQKTQ